jgi:hypothetical protein
MLVTYFKINKKRSTAIFGRVQKANTTFCTMVHKSRHYGISIQNKKGNFYYARNSPNRSILNEKV